MKHINIPKAVTQWFSASTSPVHIGIYERRYTDSGLTHYSFWDGSFWYESRPTVEAALQSVSWSIHQKGHFEWRGLATMPVYRPFENPLKRMCAAFQKRRIK